MARPVDGTLRRLLGEIDPRRVAAIYDGYGWDACAERWHWCRHHLLRLVAEGRRMRAAGETWSPANRKAA